MTEDRHVHEGSARRAPAHIHSHRALIGFDANGVPTVTHRADHCAEEDDPDAFIRDYNAAVAAYRKTFPTRDEVAEKTPDPAVREMLARAKSLGLETAFDRFDRHEISSRGLRGGRRFDRLAQSFAFSRSGGSATRYARARGYVGAEVGCGR